MTEIKRIHMIIFWPTSMLDIFSATTQSVKMVVPIYDFKTSTDIKKGATESINVPQRSGSYSLAEFEAIFLQIILKKVGHDDRVIIMLYKVMNTFSARHRSNFERPKIDVFLSEISENGNVNISVKIKMHDIRQVILLSYHHKRIDIKLLE